MIWIGFRFDTEKKLKSLGNSGDRLDQVTGWNDVNTLEIPGVNLELKQMFIICS